MSGRKYIKQNGQIGVTTGVDAEHALAELIITDADPIGSGGPPSGPATGDLSGTYPAPTIAALAVTDAKVAAANKDGAAGVPSLRTIGTGALQATAGNDSRLTDSRSPTGSAGGDLTGGYPNPTLAASGPGAISKGSASKSAVITTDAKGRVATLTEVSISGAGIDTTALHSGDAAGGDLAGAYPNPTLATAGPGATGPIGDSTHVAVVTIDAKGRVTGLTPTAISGGAAYTAGTGLTLATTVFSIDTAITVDKTTAQTLTNKTLTSPVLNTGVSGTAVDTDSTMAANSDTLLSSQKAIKAALALKAPIASPVFTGVVGLPLGEVNVTAPIGSLVTRHGGVYVGKRALDKWRYTKSPYRTVVTICDSTGQGDVGGLDPWPERLARDLGNWNGPRLTAGAGYYPLYRSGSLLYTSNVNGDREWYPWGPWTPASGLNTFDLAPFSSNVSCLNAAATAIRTVADGVTTINSGAITSATMAFVAGDVGALITGTNIPANTRIVAVASGTAATMSQRATATGTALAMNIHGATLTWTRNLGNSNGARLMYDLSSTSGVTTITCPSANFQSLDVGKAVTSVGPQIAAGTTIASVTDYQTAVLSQAAAATNTGSAKLIIHEGRNVTDLVTTNTSTTITSATAKFVSQDVNCRVMGTNIPGGSYIASVQSPTTATISAAATGTGSALPLFVNAYRAQRFVGDIVTNGTTTVSSITAAFTQDDVGRHVAGTGVPNNCTIVSVTDSSHAVLSVTMAGTNTVGVLNIGGAIPLAISHLEIVWIDGIASHGTNFTYSTDGGTTWVQVAQTTTGGTKLMKTLVAIVNPTTLIIRANTGPGNSPTTKSQTIQCGINAYQAAPGGPGLQMYNMSRDGFTLTSFVHGGVGDSMAMLDNGLGGTNPGLQPDLIVVMFINDQIASDITRWTSALNRLLDRTQSYADIVFLGGYEVGDGRVLANTTTPFNLAMKTAALTTGVPVWTCVDGVTTNASAVITSANMGFTQADAGRAITDSAGKIPGGTKILSVQSATSATLTANATGASTANTFTITAGTAVDTGSAFIDLYEAYAAEGAVGFTAANADGLMFDLGHPSQVGHNEIGARVSRLIRVFS